MAQVSAEQWEESLIDRVVELSPDQFCALFDLARAGLAPMAERDRLLARISLAGDILLSRELVAEQKVDEALDVLADP
jgi:hypothetical protein